MLGPERSTPCVVHRFDRAVPFLAPVLERAFGVLGIVEAVVASVLVTNVPSNHIGIVLVMLRHRPAELKCVLKNTGLVGTPVAGARPAGTRHRGSPSTSTSGCAWVSHIGGDAVAEARSTAMPALPSLSMLVEPAEIVHVFAGFDFSPRRRCPRYEVHSRLDHEAHVLVRDLLGPLVGIVAAVPNTGQPAVQQPGRTIFSTLVHCRLFLSLVIEP